MDKRIENAMNELINTEIWSTGLYLSLQVYFEDERLPILSSWLNSQAQDNMNKVYQMMNRICHDGGCVVINEMKRDTHEWTTPLNALNELLEHEQYISRQVNLKSATTRLYDTEAKIICIVSKKGAQCIECHHKDI